MCTLTVGQVGSNSTGLGRAPEVSQRKMQTELSELERDPDSGVLRTPGKTAGRQRGEELLSGTGPPACSLLARHPPKGSSERGRGPEAQATGGRQLTVHTPGGADGGPREPGREEKTGK